MTTTTTTTTTGEPLTAAAFLDRHAPKLIERAKNATGELRGNAEVTAQLKAIYEDFDKLADKPGKRESLPGEDVFWWCVTILEELEESAATSEPADPYLSMMLEQLKDMGKRLEERKDLPARFGIHWFDELDQLDETLI